MHVKVFNGWSNKSSDMLLELLKATFLMCSTTIPSSFYETERKPRDLGMWYKIIHACKYDCVLYWKMSGDLQQCPTCGESQYKVSPNRGKKSIHKVLCHFPLTPRLYHLFVSQKCSPNMRWNKNKEVEIEEVLRYPTDAEVWKHFDCEFSNFALNSRNVRLGFIWV